MSKTIVWVMGSSATGKETFIHELILNKNLQKTYNLSGRIEYSRQSLMNLGDLSGTRFAIIEEAVDLLTKNDAVVIKWQYGDTKFDIPLKIAQRLPDCLHQVILLETTMTEKIRRLKTKSWWQDKGNEISFIHTEQLLLQQSIDSLPANFKIIKISW